MAEDKDNVMQKEIAVFLSKLPPQLFSYLQ